MTPTEPLASEKTEFHALHGLDFYKWLNHLINKPVTGLELGVGAGESAEWMLEHIFTDKDARYHGVDSFEGSDEDRLGGVDCSGFEAELRAKLERFGHRAQIFKCRTSDSMLSMFRDQRFDFVYVDASRDSMNVLRDSLLAFELLKADGIMVWNAYEWDVMEQAIDRPKMAIESFLNCYARRLEVIGVGSQIAVRKTG